MQDVEQTSYYREYRRYVPISFDRTVLYTQVLIGCRMRVQADVITKVERLQLEIVKLVTERRVEMDVLHHRVQGGKMARTFINRLNSRCKPLELLVAKYNLEVGKPLFRGRLRPLSLQALNKRQYQQQQR